MIVVVDYGVGNLASIRNMFRKAGADAVVSSDEHDVLGASHLVLPGVGAFDNGMRRLRASGLVPAITAVALEERRPVLGICLGMQLLGRCSEEGEESGLGWLDADTCRFRPEEHPGLKVPHMGWSPIEIRRPSPLLNGHSDQRFYFLHSYHLECRDPVDVVAVAVHGNPFTCVVSRDNIHGVQFHPEKSHRFGLGVLGAFARLT